MGKVFELIILTMSFFLSFPVMYKWVASAGVVGQKNATFRYQGEYFRANKPITEIMVKNIAKIACIALIFIYYQDFILHYPSSSINLLLVASLN